MVFITGCESCRSRRGRGGEGSLPEQHGGSHLAGITGTVTTQYLSKYHPS